MSLLVLPIALCAEENQSTLPVIKKLNPDDVVFKQFTDDVAQGRRLIRAPRRESPNGTLTGAEELAASLNIYLYDTQDGEDLYRIAAFCIIPYGTIATLNRVDAYSKAGLSGTTLMLPTVYGIFLPDEPVSDIEKLVASSRGENSGVPITINNNGKKLTYRFIPGDDFTPNERTFFINPQNFKFPLSYGRLTSAFGPRISPISGKNSIHKGLDLAAPQGSPVFASRAGTVTDIGDSPVYGKYIIITHDKGWTSLYGHLSEVNTSLNSNVKTMELIGKVGSSGLSTGPHLHFELRQGGKPHDPNKLLSPGK